MERMNFVDAVYSQNQDRESLVTSLCGLLDSEEHLLTIIPYACEESPSKWFKADGTRRTIEKISANDEIVLYKLVFHPLIKDNSQELSGKFYVINSEVNSNIFLILSIETSDFINKALLPFIHRQRPSAYFTFIKHSYLKILLQNFRKNQGFTDLRVGRASWVSRFSNEKKETMIPSVSWPKLGLDGTFDYAQEQNGWFKSLTFEALRDSKVVNETTIYRNGIIKTNGDFPAVYNSLILPICESMNENIRLFSKRSRRDNPDFGVRPLAIEFDQDQFTDINQNIVFIEAMRKLENISLSVIHGNPYVALTIIDYIDGSTFDLWVLNERELVIVPQMKSSILSIKRLINSVFDNYAEGTVRDFQY